MSANPTKVDNSKLGLIASGASAFSLASQQVFEEMSALLLGGQHPPELNPFLVAARDKAVTAAKREQLQKETAELPGHVAKMRR